MQSFALDFNALNQLTTKPMLIQNSIYLDLAIDLNPIIVAPKIFVLEAIRLMNQSLNSSASEQSYDRSLLEARAGCVLVVNENKLIGIFSKWDILELVQKQVNLQSLPIVNLLSTPPIVIRRSQIHDLESMLNLLYQSRCRHLPVLDDFDKIIGVATQESILFAKNKLAEDTLANVEDQKRAVLNAIPDLIYRVSVDGIYLECFSSNYVTDLLPSDFDPISKHLSDVLPSDLANRKLHAIKQAIATDKIQSFEQRWDINGQIQHEEVQIVKVSDQEVLTIIRNISDRKQAEEALRESEMRFRSVFDNAAVGISLAALDGKYLAVNQALCQMLGYSEKELQVLTFQELTHPEDLEIDLYHYQKLLSNEIDGFHIEKRFRHQDGQFIWGLMSVSIVRDPENQPMYDIALIQNINELKTTQQELSKLNQELEIRIQQRTADLQMSNEKLIATNKELERVTRLKDEFLATMSHELRTPLNAVLGISEGLLEQVFGELNQRQQGSLKTIHKSGQHLLELINDILDVAKIEAGMFILDLTSVSVRYLCESSLSFVKHLATQKNIQLNLIIHDSVPTEIVIDERRMRQLLINLLSNAVKFTPKNGTVILESKFTNVDRGSSEKYSEENLKNEIQFSVSDNGIGISMEDINKLFQPFVQIHSSLSRQYAGTGLGLNLVKKLAELHGGQVSVESKVGEGSCFTVRFPFEYS
jgi:PAS domain S-box-containing protein